MIFDTLSGSKYEVDLENKQIRRLEGTADPTPRQGADGEWKQFLDISGIKKNSYALIIWACVDGVAKTTLTSQIVRIEEAE